VPDDENHELLIARIVAAFAEWGLGRPIGEPTLNDDGRADALVDVLFEDAQPPVALEVTAIVDGQFVETARATEPAADRLWRYAEKLDLGFWTIELVSGTRIKPRSTPHTADSRKAIASRRIPSIGTRPL